MTPNIHVLYECPSSYRFFPLLCSLWKCSQMTAQNENEFSNGGAVQTDYSMLIVMNPSHINPNSTILCCKSLGENAHCFFVEVTNKEGDRTNK